MKKINSLQLLEQLQADTRQLIVAASHLQSETETQLTRQPAAGKWSVTQVLEHLNSYSQYYLPAIENAMAAKEVPAAVYFKPGWLGNYFTNLMKPKHGVVANKMKSPKNHRPSAALNAKKTITTFLEQQRRLLELLEKAKATSIGDIRVPVSISTMIRLKLGDSFRFLIAHEQRHFVQIENTLQTLGEINGKDPVIHLVA